MKKIMLSTVILLPIVVLLVLLVSSSIIGSTAHIYVDSIAFADGESEIRLKWENPEDKDNAPVYRLDVEIRPLNARNRNLIYSCDNESVCVVDENGNVTAVDYGTARISVASAENPAKAIQKTVIVYDDKVHRIEWKNKVDELYLGEKADFEVDIIPKEAIKRGIEWTSDNPDILSVTPLGAVYAISAGEATIRATSVEDDDVYAECRIFAKPVVTGIAFADDLVSNHLTIDAAETDFPAVKLLPEGAREKITYSTSDESLAAIDENGHIVFKDKGVATFTASVNADENNSYSIEITINYNGGYYTLLAFDKDVYECDFDEYPTGTKLPIKLNAYPSDTKKDIDIEFSREGVAEASENGKEFFSVAPYAMSVCITASSETADGSAITARCFVYLYHCLTSVTAPETVKAENGICFLKELLTFAPADYTSELTFAADDDETATIYADGTVIFKKAGQVEVTVSSADDASVNCVVTVTSESAFEERKKVRFEFDDLKTENGEVFTSSEELQFNILTTGVGELKMTAADMKEGEEPNELDFNDSSVTVISSSETADGKLYSCSVKFDGKGKKIIRAVLSENGNVISVGNIVAESTYGTATEIFVTEKASGQTVENGDSFVIPDIGGSLEFLVEVEAPEDLVTDAGDIKVNVVYNDSDAAYLYDISTAAENGKFVVRLSARNATYTEEGAYVSVVAGGLSRKFTIKNNAPAHYVEAYYENVRLDPTVNYKVFTDKLELFLRGMRRDGIRPTEKTISYEYCGVESSVENGEKIIIDVMRDGELIVESGSHSITVKISEADTLDDFGLSVFAMVSGSGYEALNIESVTEAGDASLLLPASMQGGIAIRIILPDNVLGALGNDDDDMREIVELTNVPSDWKIPVYYPALKEIILTPPSLSDGSVKGFDETLELKYGQKSFALNIRLSDFEILDFKGYDMKNVNDVYKGLQQAGVYAKHSYYDGKITDYFKIPLVADGNVALLQWTMTETDKYGSKVVSSQSGEKILYNGKEYTLSKDGTVRDESGKIVVSDAKNPEGIVFIDPFSESGFAKIYFGAARGLTEQDISEDNFGDFDETGLYNSGSAPFMRVEVSDGTSLVYEYFNFNIAEDITDESGTHELVNIVDRDGFKANKYIVLHTDLYGPEEYPDAKESLVLDAVSDEEATKELIYGNGYGINFRQRSLNALENNLSFDKVWLGRVYNATLKGTTADSSQSEYVIGFAARKQFYCIVQACKDGMYGDEGEIYAKNTIYRYIAESAVQLRAEIKCTVENIVIVDCLKGLETWYDGENPEMGFYILGFLDVINYRSEDEEILTREELVQNLKKIFIPEIKKSGIEYTDRIDPEKPDREVFWANIVMASSDSTRFNSQHPAYEKVIHFGKEQKTNTIIPYGDKTYPWGNSYFDNYNDGDYTYGFQRANSMYLAAKYLDIGVYTYMGRKDICIDCQLLDGDLPNTLHLAWHMNRVYRSHELVGWRAEDHDRNLEQSLNTSRGIK